MTPKRIKPVKAWAAVVPAVGIIIERSISVYRREVAENYPRWYYRAIPVLITPIPHRKRKKK